MEQNNIKNSIELVSCLACGNSGLKKILDLGSQPLANDFKKNPDINEVFPLKLNFCQICSHLQLSHSVDRELIFSNYLYVSGTTQTLKDYFLEFAKSATEKYYGFCLIQKINFGLDLYLL